MHKSYYSAVFFFSLLAQSLTFPPAGRNVTSVVIHSQAPLQQSLPPSGYPLYYPGYHPLPVQPVYHGMPNLTPQPPSYVEASELFQHSHTFIGPLNLADSA